MMEDFNIRDSFWNPLFPHHSMYKDSLFDITNLFQLELSKPTEFFPTRYSNSVLDLVFLWPFSTEFNNYQIHSDWRLTSDYTLITINISIFEKCILTKKWSLIKKSEEENHFIKELMNSIEQIDMFSIQSIKALENVIQILVFNIDSTWLKYSKNVNITKHSKVWWNEDCCSDINKY